MPGFRRRVAVIEFLGPALVSIALATAEKPTFEMLSAGRAHRFAFAMENTVHGELGMLEAHVGTVPIIRVFCRAALALGRAGRFLGPP